MQTKNSRCQLGFTLIEVLVSIGIGSILLVAAFSLLFTYSQVSINVQQSDFFHKHTLHLERFLEHSISSSLFTSQNESAPTEGTSPSEEETSPPADRAATEEVADTPNTTALATNTSESNAQSIFWKKPDSFSRGDDPLLGFIIYHASPLLNWNNQPTGQIECLLQFEADEGLFLLWQPALATKESIADEPTYYRTQLSSFVTNINYGYYDADKEEWESESTPEENNDQTFDLPQALQINLEYQGEAKTIWLPLPSQSIPIP